MKLKKHSLYLLACTILVLTPSCFKYPDAIESEFYQGKKVPTDNLAIAQHYRRAITVYEEFETKASFAAIFLSDNVRKAYVDLYSHKRGLAYAKKEEMLKRNLEENRHWATFYVLADIRERTYSSLSEPQAQWTVSLKLDAKTILVPDKIKEIDLDPEYQSFFGPLFSYLKTPYIVTFPLTPEQAEIITSKKAGSISLVFRSPRKEAALHWKYCVDLPAHKRVQNDKDFYWG